MTLQSAMPVGLESDRPEAERYADESDRAAAIDAAIQADALADHRRRMARDAGRHQPGTCTNCGELLASLAIYCDAHCRADDERRQAAQQRHGGVR